MKDSLLTAFSLTAMILAPVPSKAGIATISEAVCNVTRVSVVTEQMVSVTVKKELKFDFIGVERDKAVVHLSTALMPHYVIEYSSTTGGRSDSVELKTFRKADGHVVSSFNSEFLLSNSNTLTSESAYTAKAKNVFVSGSEEFVFDISCYKKVEKL